jgi:nitrate/nitrite-specific signal transduction histidine kinase
MQRRDYRRRGHARSHGAVRERELAALLDIARAVGSTLELEPLLGVIMDQLRTVVPYTAAVVLVAEGEELVELAYRGPGAAAWRPLRFPVPRAPVPGGMVARILGGEPVVIGDVFGDTPLAAEYRRFIGAGPEPDAWRTYRAWAGVPLTAGDRLVGMLSLTHPRRDTFTPRHVALMRAFAAQAATAMANARLYAESRRFAALAERQRLARGGVPVSVSGPEERVALAPDTEEQLYRLAMEALHNAVAHAGARRIAVHIAARVGGIALEVADDGAGFDPDAAYPGHLGLATMTERARRIGGALTIASAPGAGTAVRLTLAAPAGAQRAAARS